MRLAEGNTFAVWRCLPSTVSDMNLNSRLALAHCLGSNVGQVAFVHMSIAGGGHEDQHG